VSKKTFYAAEKEHENVQKQRVAFWQQIREFPVDNLVFIDESGVNNNSIYKKFIIAMLM